MASSLLNIRVLLVLSALLLISCRSSPNSGAAPRNLDNKCPVYSAEGVEASCLTLKNARYVVIRIDLKAARIKLLWKNPSGVSYSSLGEAYRQLGGDLLALTNAGIYSRNHAPEGLHVEDGKTLNPLNLNDGEGNFYWKPNGVFYVTDNAAGIVESQKLNTLPEPETIREATQSGPMLVIDGEVNPNLNPDSTSLHVRNGIGIKPGQRPDRHGGLSDAADEVYIVISEEEVSLHDFASVFSDQLHCPNALYLDGCVSQLYLPARDRYVPERRRCEKDLVGLLAVEKRR